MNSLAIMGFFRAVTQFDRDPQILPRPSPLPSQALLACNQIHLDLAGRLHSMLANSVLKLASKFRGWEVHNII